MVGFIACKARVEQTSYRYREFVFVVSPSISGRIPGHCPQIGPTASPKNVVLYLGIFPFHATHCIVSSLTVRSPITRQEEKKKKRQRRSWKK
jgi:hypothetical protein